MNSIIFLILAIICNFYFIALQVASPNTFLGTIFSFSSIWFILSVFFIVMFIFRKKRLWKNAKKSTKKIVIAIISIGFVIASINLFFITHPRLTTGEENVKYVIILGGGITKDATISDSVKQRLKYSAEYLKKNPNSIAVVTGGKGHFSPCPESDILKPELESYGIESKRILAENKAKDTIQNFQYSAKLIAENQNISIQEVLDSEITVITSDFHIARAEILAKRMGFTNIYGAASKTPLLFIPNSYAREICSYIKLNLRILLTGKPKKISD